MLTSITKPAVELEEPPPILLTVVVPLGQSQVGFESFFSDTTRTQEWVASGPPR